MFGDTILGVPLPPTPAQIQAQAAAQIQASQSAYVPPKPAIRAPIIAPPTYTPTTLPPSTVLATPESNTTLYVGIGIALLVLAGGAFMLISEK